MRVKLELDFQGDCLRNGLVLIRECLRQDDALFFLNGDRRDLDGFRKPRGVRHQNHVQVLLDVVVDDDHRRSGHLGMIGLLDESAFASFDQKNVSVVCEVVFKGLDWLNLRTGVFRIGQMEIAEESRAIRNVPIVSDGVWDLPGPKGFNDILIGPNNQSGRNKRAKESPEDKKQRSPFEKACHLFKIRDYKGPIDSDTNQCWAHLLLKQLSRLIIGQFKHEENRKGNEED